MRDKVRRRVAPRLGTRATHASPLRMVLRPGRERLAGLPLPWCEPGRDVVGATHASPASPTPSLPLPASSLRTVWAEPMCRKVCMSVGPVPAPECTHLADSSSIVIGGVA